MIKEEELNFADPQFQTTMIPGKFQRFMRHCIPWQFIRMVFFSFRSLGIIMINLRNEKEIDVPR